MSRRLRQSGNYMRLHLLFGIILYTLILFLLGRPTEPSDYYRLAPAWFAAGVLKYASMTAVWGGGHSVRNIMHRIGPFPIDRSALRSAHRKGIFGTELILTLLTYMVFAFCRGSLLPEKWDLILLAYLFILPFGIAGIWDGVKRNRGMKW